MTTNDVLVHSLFVEPILHFRSNQDTAVILHRRRRVAIVGARACTEYGAHVAADLGAKLTEAGCSIVSGLAFGIDAAAHRGALSAVRSTTGRPIAVLPSGINVCYPRAHTELLNRVIDEGMVVSQFPDDAAPSRHNFLARNRTIALLAEVVIVVEAAPRSGSISAAGYAMDLLRPVGAVPGPVTSTTSSGTHMLIRDGATLVTCADDVLEMLDGATAQQSFRQEV